MFRNQPTRNKNCLWQPCSLTDRDKFSNLYRVPFIYVFYQVLVHLAKWFQRRFFRNQSIRNKNCLWPPCLLSNLTDREQSSQGTFQRCYLLSYGSFGQMVSEEKNLKNQPISNLYRGPSIDASYQVSVHLAKQFQRRFLEIDLSETRTACGCHVC